MFAVVIKLKILKLRDYSICQGWLNVIIRPLVRSRQKDQNQRRVSEDRSRGQSNATACWLGKLNDSQIIKGEQPPGVQKYDTYMVLQNLQKVLLRHLDC